MKLLSLPTLYSADAEPLTPRPPEGPRHRHRIPKAFPKWWFALRLLQLWASTMVVISSVFTVGFFTWARGQYPYQHNNHHHGQGNDNRGYSFQHHGDAHGPHPYHHRRHHMKFALFGLFFAACVPFFYIMGTILLRARHPVGFAKCAPLVAAGDLAMMGFFAGIKAVAGKVLKRIFMEHGHQSGFKGMMKKWVKKGCKHAGKMGKEQFEKYWGNELKQGGWKAWWMGLENRQGKLSSEEMRVVRKKVKIVGGCAVKIVKGMAGVAAFFFFLSALVALYIVFTHKGQIKKHLSEFRETLRERCRAKRMRRCARQAARRGEGATLAKCCDHKCSRDIQPHFYSNDEKHSIPMDSTSQHLPVVVDAFPAPYIPGAFPISRGMVAPVASSPPPPPPPTQVPSPCPQQPLLVSEMNPPYQHSTPSLSALHTPLTRTASTVSSVAMVTEGEFSTDDEYMQVEYRHVRTPSTSSASEVGGEEERRPFL